MSGTAACSSFPIPYNPRVRLFKKKSRYAEAGVDIDAKMGAVASAAEAIRSTFTAEVLGDVGGFGGLYRPDFSKYREPVLVASTDGVGTKLKVAVLAGRHDTCGADLVNHCVNDILVQGAVPLFFLDYVATGRLESGVIEQVIGSVARGCRENGCALLGGETAEMPGVYAEGDYDLAGTIVGVVERERILDSSRVKAGDVLVGLPSAGLHTNGYSLARKIFFEELGKGPDDIIRACGNRSVADLLLAPHLSYLKTVRPLLEQDLVHAMAHITGGGFLDNVPRVLPENVGVTIKFGAWPVAPLFEFLAEKGKIGAEEMFRVFNMGIGMVLIVPADRLSTLARVLSEREEYFYMIGNVHEGHREVTLDLGP
jgi:phosphoribosylformylglycinamidine cyclo-ligase